MEDFDLIAKEFDTEKRVERAKAIADEIRLHINDGNKKIAVEYGCGTGLVGFHLINDFNSMLFADSSPAMIEQVKQKLIRLGKSADFAVCCDFMADIPHDLNADYIFMSLVLHHIKDTEAILSCLYNMLNNAGHLIIVDLNPDGGGFHANHGDFDGHNGFEQSTLVNMSKKIGFRKAESKTFYYDSKIVNDREAPYSLFILDAEK